jgi:hypothetical protein
MELSYQKRRRSLNPFAPLALQPLVQVTLSRKGRATRVWPLLDSGADTSIFDSSIAALLGIDLAEGLKQGFVGIAGRMDGYFHDVNLKLVGLPKAIKVAVAFGELQGVTGVLGQADFFQHHQVTFERYKQRIEINPAGE